MQTVNTNDLPNYLNHCDVTLYADDTVLYISSKSVYTIESELNSDLNILNWWLTLNRLSLNISKSKFIIIGSNQCLSNLDSISVTVDDKPIEEVSSFTYLGVIINKHLTWQDHVEYVSGKINKKLGLLRRIRACLPLEARLLFFNSYILPIFDYADIIWWDRGNKTSMSQLQILHNKAARIILDLPQFVSATESLSKLEWKLLNRRAEHRLFFLYKCINNLFSCTFNLNFNKDTHNYNTRSRNNIRKSLANRNWGLWTSINFASNDWNQLDLAIREEKSLSKFKQIICRAEINLNSNIS